MRVLILQHAPHEGPGLVGEALERAGAALDVRRGDRGDPLPPLRDYRLVVALGGPMAAWDDAAHPFLDGEARLLGDAARAGAAVLGVCLGAQLLARGLGARVYRGPRPELGLSPLALTDEGRADPLLAPLDGRDVVHWHEDTFDLPAGAARLASTAAYPNQAFRVGSRAYGVQFHIELDRAARREWARLGERELRAAGVDPASLDGDDALDERGRAFARAVAASL
jgi:GMP synthase (glutamine-hydrolysing)